jgi:copper resistance protein C
MRRTFGLWLAFVFVAIVVLPVALSAHLRLTKSSPTEGATVSTPRQLQLWFNEEPLLPLSSVTLTGPNGSVKIDRPRASVERSLTVAIGTALPTGTYRIAWKAAGDDGHVVAGTVDFAVKESVRPPM